MSKRILSCLLILALLLPVATAFGATMGDVNLRAHHGQTLVLNATDFTDQLTIAPEDAGLTLVNVTFPTLPAANLAVIWLDGADYAADTPVSLADIAGGDLQIRVEAGVGTRVRIPFRADLSDATTADAHIEIAIHPQAEDRTYTTHAGESIQITLGVQNPATELTYVFQLIGDENLQHGTLTALAEPGQFTYHATSAGTETFTYTVSVDGIASDPAMVTITVEAAPTLQFMPYKDMPSHWASFSAGRLAHLGKLIGMQADNRFFFHPDRGITRGDFLIWLCAVLDIEPTSAASTIYADPDIPQWMMGFLDAATIAGVIEGVPAASPAVTSYFFPHAPVTRIEAISMVSRALGPDGHDDDLTGLFLDITEIPAWGKNAVRHLAERQVIVGEPSGYLHPGRNLSRAEGAELLYKALKDMVHTPAPVSL